MGDFSKPKVTIDLEEYDSLLANQDLSSVELLRLLVNTILSTKDSKSKFYGKKALSIEDIISLAKDNSIKATIYKVNDEFEIATNYGK